MTGSDIITCRRLYQDFFEYQPQFKLWIATNNLPKVTGVDEAIWRRIRVIRFPVTIPEEERDPNLTHDLKTELRGILNWALEGLKHWKDDGLKAPTQVTQATGEYRLENDTVAQFIEACCDKDPRVTTTAKVLYDRYLCWCSESGFDAIPKNIFGKTLAQKGLQRTGLRAGSAWNGLRLKPLPQSGEAVDLVALRRDG
jgi:putative DNA primase/helicase